MARDGSGKPYVAGAEPVKSQRGIVEGWILLIGVLLLIGAVTGLVVAWKSYTDGIDKKGYDRGVKETTTAYAQRDNEALKLKAARISELETSARAMEAKHAQQLAAIETKRIKEKSDAKAQHERDQADIAAGKRKLFDPNAIACQSGVGDQRAGAETSAGTAGSNGGATGELSRQATEFLYDFANDADDLARQLASAQAVIIEDRVTCNQP